MKKAAVLVTLALFALALTPARAGHELPYYPSYYPQEIRIEMIDPDSAADYLKDARIHAYVGSSPSFQGKIPSDISYVESLNGFLVLTFNSQSSAVKTRKARIEATRTIVGRLPRLRAPYIFHPYPITPYHMDYLYHFDLAQAAKEALLKGSTGINRLKGIRMRARGRTARRILRSMGVNQAKGWDVSLQEIALEDLLSPHMININGWIGPPWLHEGWFQAYLLLRPAIMQSDRKEASDEIYQRLVKGAYSTKEERMNLERRLISVLTQGYERVVVGYILMREYFNEEYSAGIENIAYDAQSGFNSAIFIRTVKLKDFPWNGWLRLGIPSAPDSAWNPIGGFTDPAGRLIWYALGDPAFFPAPYNGSWILNRIGDFR